MAYRVEEASLTAVADAIREKSGTSEGLTFPEGFVNAVAGIQAGGGNEILDAVLDGSVTELVSNVETVSKYKFYKNTSLTTINLPSAVTLDNYAFYGCTKLANVYFPKVRTIGEYCFSGNQGTPGFREVTDLMFPSLQNVMSNAFENSTTIEVIDLSNEISFGTYCFANCTNLKEVRNLSPESINSYMFRKCKSLIRVSTFTASSVGMYAFNGCTSLGEVDAPLVGTIKANAFYGCTVLTKIILRPGSICTLEQTNAFNGTPFASGGTGGTVYVPEALIESYKTASNWSTLYNAGTCNFVAIEGSEYE